MGRYTRLLGRPRPCEFRKAKKVITIDVDWHALAIAGTPEGMEVDPSSVKILQTLTLSNSDVNGVALGKNFVLATGSSDKRIEVCRWESGNGFAPTEYSPLRDHKYTVSCVDFSPYGTILASASVDGNTILWDTTTGEKFTSFVQPGNSSVRVCQFSCRSTLLLTAGDCGGVHLWDVTTRTLIRTFSGHEEAVYAASFAPDESYLVSGCSAGLLYLWDGSEKGVNKPIASFENAHDLGITCLNFAPSLVTSDGGMGKLCLMVTGGHDHFVKLWNVTLGLQPSIQLLRVLQGHSESVMCVRISGIGGLIASTSGDKTVRLWDLNGQCLKVLEGHDRFVTSCGFSPDGKLLASGSNDKKVIIWDLTGSIELSDDLVAPTNEFSLSAGDVWPQYEKLCRSRMLQEENGVALKTTFQVPKVDFNSCTLIGTSYVVAAASSKCVYAWNLDTEEEVDITSICSHKYAVNSVAYCPNRNIIASASTDGTINLFNLQEKVGGIYHPSGGALRVCKFSVDGTYMIAAGDDEKASLWNMDTRALIKQFDEHESAIYAAAFSPDGQYCVTGCVNGHIKLWDCIDSSTVASLTTHEAHELGVACCDFSPKGLGGAHGQHRFLLATGGNDSLVKLWHVIVGPETGAQFILIQAFTDHGTANVMCVTFAPSGKLLASAAGDKTIRLWDISLGTCVQVVEEHDRYVTGVAFAVGGAFLASCSSDHTVKIWQLQGSLAHDTAAVETIAVEHMLSKWTIEDVVNWLAEIGFGDLGHVFESKEVSGEKFANLSETVLSDELGIDDEGVRKQLLTEFQWMKSLGMNSGRPRTGNVVTITAPVEFFCPITHDIMVEPVTTCDGHTYERAAITEWFLTGKTTSPLTNIELESMTLTPNFELQNRISEFLAQRLSS
ncbi:unnamed protein product [Orchesella dallaii]|uniref:WD repeat, SAM and U-box domain-containing protein 1 n=2 Tax=Orchesella dallaii TaxID=48710 RepID=A0ABP1Q7P6_9HEXA